MSAIDPAGMQNINLFPLGFANPVVHEQRDQPAGAVAVTLNGRGGAPLETYLEAGFATRVQSFTEIAAQNGVTLEVVSAYRDPERQAALRADPAAITPAANSLHSAGRAIDVRYLDLAPEQQQIIRDAASAAGLSWGGDFRTPDPVHFYHDPGGDRTELIDEFTEQVNELRDR